MPRLRYYITGHGLGHASRACQVIGALAARHPRIHCSVVSDAAPWFLADNLPPGVKVTRSALDIGVLQFDSLVMRPEATLAACRRLREQAAALIDAEATSLQRDRVDLVVTDVAALPCAAAGAAGIPALIFSNFTWDWIYEGFLDDHPEFAEEIDWQRSCYRQAQRALRLPFHGPMPAPLEVIDLPLVARRSQTSRATIRRQLDLGEGQRLGLFSFGGFGLEEAPLTGIARHPEWIWLAEPEMAAGHASLRPLPPGIAYPDLVNAADVVVTKPGYGIVAECLAHRTPVLFTPRGAFREQPLLVAGLKHYGRALEIDNVSLRQGNLQEALESLLALPQPAESLAANGADVAADHLAGLLR